MAGSQAALQVDLSGPGVDTVLMDDPNLYGLGHELARVEHWAFDRDREGHVDYTTREEALRRASEILSRKLELLTASEPLVHLVVSLTSPRRFVLLAAAEKWNPSLPGELVEFAFTRIKADVGCAQFIQWLDLVERAAHIQRIFGPENTKRVCEVLAQLKQQTGNGS